ncbi:MAG TPA: TetR family transcriptional regulator [Streptosporangiaceae bacterium]
MSRAAKARGGRNGAGRPPGRPAGDSGTRAAIGEAARAQFADHGYRGATIRGIAAAAGVDPALVHHYYGSKEALFAAAMRLPVLPSEVMTAALTSPAGFPGTGTRLVAAALSLWESDALKDTFLGLLKSAVTSEHAAAMLRDFVTDSILGTMVKVTGLADRVSPAEAGYRAAMVATQMLGLAMTRLVLRLPPVAAASVEELAATVGPSVERYLSGEIELPAAVAGSQRRT